MPRRKLTPKLKKEIKLIAVRIEAEYKNKLKYGTKYTHSYLNGLGLPPWLAAILNSSIDHTGNLLDNHPEIVLGLALGGYAAARIEADPPTAIAMALAGSAAFIGLKSDSEAVGIASMLTITTNIALIIKGKTTDTKPAYEVDWDSFEAVSTQLDSINEDIHLLSVQDKEIPPNLVMMRDQFAKRQTALKIQAENELIRKSLKSYVLER